MSQERFRIKEAHDNFDKLLNSIQPNEEVCELFKLILEEKYKESKKSKYAQLKKVSEEIKTIENKESILNDKLLESVVDDETYKSVKIKLSISKNELQQQRLNLEKNQNELRDFLNFGIYLFRNINYFFQSATITTKQKILSSILDEKLVLEGKKYRTPVFKDGFNYIYQNINKLKSIKTKMGDNFETISHSVPGVGLEPTRP